MRVEDGFRQTPYEEPNPYTDDLVLPSLLRRLLKESGAHTNINADLVRFGDRVIAEIRQISAKAGPPTLVQYDQWGKRIDELHTSEGWRELKKVAQSEGLVSIFYERKYGEFSRVYGFAKAMLMVGDGQVIFCPLSMTDGCARVLELIGTADMKRDILPRLISRDPAIAYTSGQWMTEQTGGSDVSQTETTATLRAGPAGKAGSTYELNGFKWFSSATDSDVAVALARTGPVEDGSRSLSLFLVPLVLPFLRAPGAARPPSTSNGILVHRLKNKVGTHAVPTAELSLDATEAYLLSPLNGGVRAIAPVLNITRMHSAVGSLGSLRRALAIARAYARVRAVRSGRSLLANVPLHVAELAKIGVIYRALAHLVFGAVHLLGKSECGTASADEELRLRLLTPTVKAFAAEKTCTAMEECMAAIGGQGYMEENAIGRLIRDCLVEKIWEGTITVLSLDLVRVARESKAVQAYMQWAHSVIKLSPSALKDNISSALETLRSALDEIPITFTQPIPTLVPRPALMLFAHVTAALYLLEHAAWSHSESAPEHATDAEVFVRWVEEGGLTVAVRDVQRMRAARVDRERDDLAIVYGSQKQKSKL